MSASTTPAAAAAKSAKAYSCVRCFERKVKCDRESPCSNCARSNHECIFRVPPAPRRRKKRTQEEILKARLDRYEQILKDKGIDVHSDGFRAEDLPDDDDEHSPRKSDSQTAPPATSTQGSQQPGRLFVSGKLLVDKGRSRFIENGLWTSVSEEFRRPGDGLEESDDEDDDGGDAHYEVPDYVLGLTPSSPGVRELHPLPQQVFSLWQSFLDNVNPLTKLVHPPTLQPKILAAASDTENLPKNLEVLLFSIYTIAVLSMQPHECESLLGEDRRTLLTRYRAGTKRALARAKFMGTLDVIVLTAFVLHLLATRDVYDSRTIWTLSGVASRLAEGMGLHREGSTLGLNPFETEMRRRLWWQIMMLDFRTAEMSGSGHPVNLASWNVRLPTNVNDEDLWPDMKEPPTPSTRTTEMVFCLTRYELANFWKARLLAKDPEKDFNTIWQNFKTTWAIEEKDKAIGELEQLLEQKYVRYCDPSVPVEFMAIIVARASTNTMRLMTHHPRRYAKDEDVPETERKFLWDIAVKLVDTDKICHSSGPMKRFTWHTDHYFQWSALIYLLEELRRQPLSENADKSWQQIHSVFQNHPDFVTKTKKPIFFAAGNLVLKAWKAREEAQSRNSIFAAAMREPEYITTLKQQREEANAKKDHSSTIPPLPTPANTTTGSSSSNFNPSPTTNSAAAGNNAMPAMQMPPAMPNQQPQQQQQQLPQMQYTSPAGNPYVEQMSQRPQYFWWDYSNMSSDPQTGSNNNLDFGSSSGMNQLDSLQQHPLQDVPMDWSQWDVLINDIRPIG